MTKKDISILVVDDKEFMLEKMKKILGKLGYEDVTTSKDVYGVRDYIKTNLPEVLLMDTDLKVVGCDGTDICKSLREKDYGKNMVIMGMSSNPFCEKDWLSAGADDFISKAEIRSNQYLLEEKIENALKKYSVSE